MTKQQVRDMIAGYSGPIRKPSDIKDTGYSKPKLVKIKGQERYYGAVINALLRGFVRTRDWQLTIAEVKARYRQFSIDPVYRMEVIVIVATTEGFEEALEWLDDELMETA